MVGNFKSKREEGFTIIEVLIVLAIAGLIMLIVFLAVPALQRNSRNTQMKNAAAAILGGISEFTNNNNGQLPTTVGPTAADGTVPISGGGTTTATSAKVQSGYLVSNGVAMPVVNGSIVVYLNRKCNGNAFGAAATQRAVAVGFNIENSSAVPQNQCVES